MPSFDPTRYDAAIFDCDGTLVDTMPLHHAAWRAAFERFHAPFEFTRDLFLRRAGMTLEATVAPYPRPRRASTDASQGESSYERPEGNEGLRSMAATIYAPRA